MPEASKRATYLFASSYSLMTDEDAWDAPNVFDTQILQDLVKKAHTYSKKLTDMKRESEEAAPKDKSQLEANYPFIAPFRTKRLYTSQRSDDWSIKTDVSQFTPGRRFGYNGWVLRSGDWNHQIKRTPIDASFTTYQDARPTKGQ